jgi:hypothetical protein
MKCYEKYGMNYGFWNSREFRFLILESQRLISARISEALVVDSLFTSALATNLQILCDLYVYSQYCPCCLYTDLSAEGSGLERDKGHLSPALVDLLFFCRT